MELVVGLTVGHTLTVRSRVWAAHSGRQWRGMGPGSPASDATFLRRDEALRVRRCERGRGQGPHAHAHAHAHAHTSVRSSTPEMLLKRANRMPGLPVLQAGAEGRRLAARRRSGGVAPCACQRRSSWLAAWRPAQARTTRNTSAFPLSSRRGPPGCS